MRVSVFFIFIFPFLLVAQEILVKNTNKNQVPAVLLQKISVNFSALPLLDALTEIALKGNLHLNYNESIIPIHRMVSLKLEDSSILDVLQKILDQTGIEFVVTKGNQIVLIRSKDLDAEKKFTISGYVADFETGEALIGTNVTIEQLQLGCATNHYGFFSLTIPPGYYTICFNFIGYLEKKMNVYLNHNLEQYIELISTPISGDTVTVRANVKDNFITNTEIGTIDFTPKDVSDISILWGERDILRTLHLLPGVSQTREADCGFYVRGGNSDQNLVLLDEASIHNAFHLLGTFSVFNSDAIRDIKLIKGSAPPKYGGKLSSVLDIQMKEGNMKRFRGDGGIGLIFSRLTLEGPIVKEKGSFILSGRRTYADIFTKLSSEQAIKNSTLYFYDFNLKTNYRFSVKDHFYLSGYSGKDVLGVGGEDEDDGEVAVEWGNKTATFRWNHLFNEKLFSNSSLIFGNFKYSMAAGEEEDKVEVSSLVNDVSLKEDFQYFKDPNNALNFGFFYTYHTYQPSRMLFDGNEDLDILIGKKKANEGGIYLSHEWQANSRIKLNYGLRYSIFSVSGEKDLFDFSKINDIPDNFWDLEFHDKENKLYLGLEPRLSGNFMLNSARSLKFGYARNYQNVHLLSNSTSGTPLNVWHPSSTKVKPQYADQISFGYFQNFETNKVDMSVELFYKDMRNQLDYKDGADVLLSSLFESELAVGRGRAYGLEFLLQKKLNKFSGWIGYTWSRSKREFDEINNGTTYPASQDHPHDMAIVAIYKLNPRLTLSTNWIYQTGTPVTVPYGKYIVDGQLVEAYTSRNAYRMPSYHRLDLGITLNTRSSGSWNFTLYNAYGRKNAYAILFQEKKWNPEAKEAVKLSLFSFMPSISYHFTF